MYFLSKAFDRKIAVSLLAFSVFAAIAADVSNHKTTQNKASTSIIFDSAGNAVFTSNNVIIGSAVNFRPAKDIKPIFPTQWIVNDTPDDPMGPPAPPEPKPPKVPDYTQPPPKPKPKDPCQNGPSCPIPLGRDVRLIKYGRDLHGVNLYKLESGVLNKEVLTAAGR